MERQNPQISTFFDLLRASLWDEPFSPAPDTDWDEIYQELRHHALSALPVDVLAKANPADQPHCLRRAAKSYSYWYSLMQTQQEITDIFEAAGVPCATIKGAAADIYYPKPANRTMGDIDIIVKPCDLDKAQDLLLNNGCTLHDDRNPRHIEFRKNNIQIELHRHFATLSDPARAQALDVQLFAALDHAEKQQIDGYSFYMLPKTENGLVLIEHINSHMEGGLGFRQIIDWMLYVDRVLDDDAWFGNFQDAVQAIGLEKLAVTVTRMCQIYLGLRQDITWCQYADTRLCERLMNHILAQGNFGRKQNAQSRGAVQVLGVMDSGLNFFQLLQRHGCYNWKTLKKHPWLKPFAWLYQLCRYIRKCFRGKNSIRNLLGAFRKKKQRNDLLEELGIQRKNHTLEYPDK